VITALTTLIGRIGDEESDCSCEDVRRGNQQERVNAAVFEGLDKRGDERRHRSSAGLGHDNETIVKSQISEENSRGNGTYARSHWRKSESALIFRGSWMHLQLYNP